MIDRSDDPPAVDAASSDFNKVSMSAVNDLQPIGQGRDARAESLERDKR